MDLSARLILLSAIIAFAHGLRGDGRIVGGVAIPIERTPYQVSLQYDGYHFCGGSIISSNFVLSAAHCTDRTSAKYLSVRIGSAQLEYGGEVINVNRYIQHKLFDPYSFDYDYSLLELKTPIIFDSAAKAPISLPSSNDVIVDSSAVFVSGWGTTEFDPNKASPILRAVTVNMINYNQCEEIYRDFGGLTVQMICAKSYKKDSCQGDSGGPMADINGKLIGVVSFGMDCGDDTFPGVYARVSAVRDWIQTNAGV